MAAIDANVPFKTGKALLVSRYERAYVEALMVAHHGNITRAARGAQIDRVYLLRLLDKDCIPHLQHQQIPDFVQMVAAPRHVGAMGACDAVGHPAEARRIVRSRSTSR